MNLYEGPNTIVKNRKKNISSVDWTIGYYSDLSLDLQGYVRQIQLEVLCRNETLTINRSLRKTTVIDDTILYIH